MAKKIVVINLGWEQEPLLDRIGNTDLDVYGIHPNKNYYEGIRYKDILIADLRDLAKLTAFCDHIQPDAIISDQCDYSYFAQAFLCERYGLPGPRIMEAQGAVNKWVQRQRAQAGGILNPVFQLCLSPQEALDFAERVGYPFILKPVDNRGSFGVHRVDNPQEVSALYQDALTHSHSRWVLAEEYIQGQHLTVDGYIYHTEGPRALALATKTKLAGKRGIIDGEITYPGNLPPDLYQQALQNAEQTAQALGLTFGHFHGEFILRGHDIYLTEMANRGGGVYTAELIVPEVSKIDLMDTYLSDVLGNFTPAPTSIQANPVRMKLFEFADLQNKTVTSIHGVREVKALPQVLALRMLIHKGDRIGIASNGGERHGVIIVKAPEPQLLDEALNDALNHLEISYE
jgi:biotin carboxylase